MTVSCQYFETERISEEEFYSKEKNTINWSDVDTYPKFKACSSITDTAESKACFEKQLTMQVGDAIKSRINNAIQTLNDTIWVSLTISEKPSITVTNIDMDHWVAEEFSEMQSWIIDAVKEIELKDPAIKRGVPVKTQYRLPIVVIVE